MKYRLLPPVPGGLQWWEIYENTDNPNRQFAVFTVWNELPQAEEIARHALARLNHAGA